MSVSDCCIRGFEWEGQPTGHTTKLGDLDTYLTGNPDAPGAILLIPDLFGWTFGNVRLLADHYAREAGVAVYVPDFFGGEVIPAKLLIEERWQEFDLRGFIARNSREIREPEIFAAARALRARHAKVGASGFCYGGWAGFRLAAAEHSPQPLVDCISVGHPSLLTESDIDGVGSAVPIQVLAPEVDAQYTAALKTRTFETLQKRAAPFDYQHFPVVEHACFVRGDEKKKGEREAMVRGKNAAVAWFKQYLTVE